MINPRQFPEPLFIQKPLEGNSLSTPQAGPLQSRNLNAFQPLFIAADSLKNKFFPTPMTFPVGEGLTPQQNTQTQQKLSQMAEQTPKLSIFTRTPKEMAQLILGPTRQEITSKYVSQGMPLQEAITKGLTEGAIQQLPMGGMENVGKRTGEIISKEVAPSIFQGFKDLSTKLLEKLKGRSVVSKQFISDLTNAPDLKQVERDLIRNVLDSYGVKAEKGIIPQELQPLAQEARKYKSAEEFVKANQESIMQKRPESKRWYGTKVGRGGVEIIENIQAKNPQEAATKAYQSFGKSAEKRGIDIGWLSEKDVMVEPLVTQSEKSQLTDFYQAVKEGKEASDQIPVQEFANKVKQELLPLKMRETGYGKRADIPPDWQTGRITSQRYEGVTLPDELRGNVANYAEHIYESPVKTRAGGIHFYGESKNYFGHTRIEDMAGEKTGKAFTGKISGRIVVGKENYQPSSIRRVIEVQSDLYQKGGLERTELGKLKWPTRTRQENIDYWKKSFSGKELNDLIKEYDASRTELKDVLKLQQYNDPTAHFRMVREEVKQAAIDGKTKLQFPTGETAMKIEGLGATSENPWSIDINIGGGGRFAGTEYERLGLKPLEINNLKVGQVIDRGERLGDEQWIITDILGDGKFKAVPKDTYEKVIDSAKTMLGSLNVKRWDWKTANEMLKENGFDGYTARNTAETFDISGKVDTSNPIYRFYEKELGSYLRNKFGAQLIKDNKGVSWWQLDIKPEQAEAPVEAFGIGLGITAGSTAMQKDEDKKRLKFLHK